MVATDAEFLPIILMHGTKSNPYLDHRGLWKFKDKWQWMHHCLKYADSSPVESLSSIFTKQRTPSKRHQRQWDKGKYIHHGQRNQYHVTFHSSLSALMQPGTFCTPSEIVLPQVSECLPHLKTVQDKLEAWSKRIYKNCSPFSSSRNATLS